MGAWTLNMTGAIARNVREELPATAEDPPVSGHQAKQVECVKEVVGLLMDRGVIRFGPDDTCDVALSGVDAEGTDSVTITITRT